MGVKLNRSMKLAEIFSIPDERAKELGMLLETVMRRTNHISPCMESILNWGSLKSNEKIFLIFQVGFQSGFSVRSSMEDMQESIRHGVNLIGGQNN